MHPDDRPAMGRLTAVVLGSAAGGGFPQWNCRCPVCRLAWEGDARVRARTQASLAVSADGKRWVLLNASPDLRAQLAATPRLQPQGGVRGSPIEAVVLTGAEVDQIAGLLHLRERQPFTVYATDATLAILADNPIFGVLAGDVVQRQPVALDAAVFGRPASRSNCSPRPARCRSISSRASRGRRKKAAPMSASNCAPAGAASSSCRAPPR